MSLEIPYPPSIRRQAGGARRFPPRASSKRSLALALCAVLAGALSAGAQVCSPPPVSDPLFPPADLQFGVCVPRQPEDHQWALQVLNAPAAWAWGLGHAYIGVVDQGIQVDHPDLRAFHSSGSGGNVSWSFDGGNFRPHLSWNFARPGPNVDEVTSAPGTLDFAGHGVHVSGIIAGTSNNAIGMSGICRGCSVMMGLKGGKVAEANGVFWQIEHGAQVVSMSFGYPQGETGLHAMEEALAFAEARDVVVTASPGNDRTAIEYPASDPTVISVGGIRPDRSFWVRNQCPSAIDPRFTGQQECGSDFGPEQDFVAPAESILSTMYLGYEHSEPVISCGDRADPQGGLTRPADGYGLCTGTSMSAPYLAGVAGLIRSENPLLTKQNVYSILVSSSSRAGCRAAGSPPSTPGSRDDQCGYGIPDAEVAVTTALGRSGNRTLDNRLTPLFSFYGDSAEDHFYTTVPQMASAALAGLLQERCDELSHDFATDEYTRTCEHFSYYASIGPATPGYLQFPGVEPCNISPCPPVAPAASIYIFTSDRRPSAQLPTLVPLYRMSYNPNNPWLPAAPYLPHRDTTYTTSVAGLELFKAAGQPAGPDTGYGRGYELDGIEGYIFPRCTPEPACMPAGTVKLMRRYKPLVNGHGDDFAIFPDSELAAMESAGYTETGGSALSDVLGYAYPNIDRDQDGVVDGFESLAGTDPLRGDSDCDGRSDGTELLTYPYSDPLDGACTDDPPFAAYVFTCTGLACSFDASGSTDDRGIASYAWDFGDGSFGTGINLSHTYATSGTRVTTLRVTDTGGHQATVSHMPSPDALPVASFTWSCVLRSCTFNASGSTDNGTIRTYAWSFGDLTGGSGVSPTHLYSAGGSYTVTLTVTDDRNQTGAKALVIAVNRPPVAVNDAVSTPPGVAVDVAVLANDSDPDGNTLTIAFFSQPGHGVISKNANGSLRYTPAAGYLGTDSFQYRASDWLEDSNTATVLLSTNNPPIARNDGWTTAYGTPTNVPLAQLLANDYDPDGDALTISSYNPAGLAGTLDCTVSTTYCRFTPTAGFRGTTSFGYTANDGKGGTSGATVRIKVGVANGTPTPQGDLLETGRGVPLPFSVAGLLTNDGDPDGDTLSAQLVFPSFSTRFGSVSCTSPLYTCTYTPAPGFTGVDTGFYRVTDGVATADAQLRFLVKPPTPAVLDAREDQIFTTTTVTYISYSSLTFNDYDPAGGPLTVVSVDPAGLVGTLDCTTFSTGCEYTRGTSDPTRFKYTVRNAQGLVDTATVTLKPGNQSFNRPPVVAAGTLTAHRNGSLPFSIFDALRYDYDPDNDQLTLMFNPSSPSGHVTCAYPAYFCTYTPNANFTGSDTLTYTAWDGTNTVSATLTVSVLP